MSDTDSNTHSEGVENTNLTSSGEGAKPNSIDIEAVAAKVAEKLMPEIQKAAQSQKDRRFADLQQKYDKVLKTLELSPEDAQSLGLKQPEVVKTETVSQNTTGNSAVGAIADAILKVAGLASDDPDVTAFNQRQFANEDEKAKEALALAARKQSNPTIPKPPAPVNTAGLRTEEAIIADMEKLWQNPAGNEKRLSELQEELKNIS